MECSLNGFKYTASTHGNHLAHSIYSRPSFQAHGRGYQSFYRISIGSQALLQEAFNELTQLCASFNPNVPGGGEKIIPATLLNLRAIKTALVVAGKSIGGTLHCNATLPRKKQYNLFAALAYGECESLFSLVGFECASCFDGRDLLSTPQDMSLCFMDPQILLRTICQAWWTRTINEHLRIRIAT